MDSKSGVLKRKFAIDTAKYGVPWNISFADINRDGKEEYFLKNYYTKIIRLDDQGSLVWENSTYYLDYHEMMHPKLADINQDGIPELYSGNKILNTLNGKILISGLQSAGCNFRSNFDLCSLGGNSIADQLTDSPGLELACGNMVYETRINNLNGEMGNTYNIVQAPSPVKDGFTSLADINNDGLLDIVVVRSDQNFDGGLWVWDPRTKSLIAQTNPTFIQGQMGGLATITDLDNDCMMDILVLFFNELRVYSYNGTNILELKFMKKIQENSGSACPTAFDLNGDGTQEIIFVDEKGLYVLNGSNGSVLDSFLVKSLTAFESPVITDINDDGHAEFIVHGYSEGKDAHHIFCFESANIPWAPARKIWNQTGYHITNVNDDGTIPLYPQNNAAFFDTDSCAQQTCHQPYNNFMCQATYRTQKGCAQWPAVDLVTDILEYSCMGDSITLKIILRNQSTNTFKHDSVNIGLYTNENNLPFYFKGWPWNKTKSVDTILFTISNIGINKIKARVNIPDNNTSFTSGIKGLTTVLECDYENNTDSLAIDIVKKTLDLGPDITKCMTSVFTLHVSSGFQTYRWSDGTQDSTYTASLSGLHSVTVTDGCGRSYSDSITFITDPLLTEYISDDLTICPTDEITFNLSNAYDWVQWFPKQYVTCDTCRTTSIQTDTTFTLIMVGLKAGCIISDSVEIAVLQPPKKDITASICKEDSYDFYGKMINIPGIYRHFVNNCDSVIELELKIYNNNITRQKEQICRGDSTFFLGKWYDRSITATYTLTDLHGCDSIITFELVVKDTSMIIHRRSLCEGDSIQIVGQWIKETGIYDNIYTNVFGCDSTIRYDVQKMSSITQNISRFLCKNDTIQIGQQSYTTPGNYTQKLQSITGCDSTLNINISLLPSSIFNDTMSICAGDSVLIFGYYHKTAGIYDKVFKAANGCDSTSTIRLDLLPVPSTKDTINICEGDSILLFGNYINKSGSYQKKYTSFLGCDSISHVVVNIAPYIKETIQMMLCEGDTININDVLVTESGSYIDTLNINSNCKKITTTKVELISSVQISKNITLCPDTSLVINGRLIDKTGSYVFDLFATTGCDSTFTAIVTQLQAPIPPVIDINCKEETYTATIAPQLPWQHQWQDGSTNDIYSIKQGGLLSVKTYTSSGCIKRYSYDLPKIPKLTDIPKLGDQLVKDKDIIALSVDLDPAQWSIRWSPKELVNCDSCFNIDVTTLTDTIITVILTHVSGCSFEQSFRIVKENSTKIVIPNIFNPESSSGNDTWTIHLPIGYTISELNIYDRWGNKVAAAKNTIIFNWDGTYKGQLMTPGVYVYQIKLLDANGKVSVLAGDVTLVR
ncbi:MAG: VCBS repeat-containing protein [Saprospiraceae bacterium]|nr:VCBS repeat-containing protein [Saprospiraceae bacterium]